MNIRDIARIADVTPGTVSKVLNNYPDVGEATRQHVLKIIEQYQYDPKEKARARKKEQEHPKIGLVVESVYNPLYSHMEDLLSIYIHNAGYIISSFHDNYFVQDKTEKLKELISAFEKEKLKGLIYIGGNFSQVPRELLESLPWPTVFIHSVLPLQTNKLVYSSIQVSHLETAMAQMQYLIDQGHRHICTVISSFIDNSVYGLRVQGYQAVLQKNGLAGNLRFFLETDYQYDKTQKAVLRHLQEHPDTTAICCAADAMVPAILRAIHDAGRSPDSLAIISFDGLDAMQYCVPSITTFAQPVLEMVKYADQLISGLIRKEQTHQSITFQPLLMKRESC